MLIATERFADKAREILDSPDRLPILSIRKETVIAARNTPVDADGPKLEGGMGGMMLYTSGTTSRPVRAL